MFMSYGERGGVRGGVKGEVCRPKENLIQLTEPCLQSRSMTINNSKDS